MRIILLLSLSLMLANCAADPNHVGAYYKNKSNCQKLERYNDLYDGCHRYIADKYKRNHHFNKNMQIIKNNLI